MMDQSAKKYPFKIWVDQSGFVNCKHEGKINELYADKLLEELSRVSATGPHKNFLLINADTEGIPDVSARKKLSAAMRGVLEGGVFKRVAVFSSRSVSKTVFKFIANAADPLGCCAKVFSSEAEARKWLEDETVLSYQEIHNSKKAN